MPRWNAGAKLLLFIKVYRRKNIFLETSEIPKSRILPSGICAIIIPGGDIVDINKIESAVNDLNAIRHILLHMASSEYLINTPDAEICSFLAESLKRVSGEIEEEIK